MAKEKLSLVLTATIIVILFFMVLFAESTYVIVKTYQSIGFHGGYTFFRICPGIFPGEKCTEFGWFELFAFWALTAFSSVLFTIYGVKKYKR
jgi:hypothetical protein